MEIQGLGSLNFPLKDSGIQTGQRILLEVLTREAGGKVQLRFAGQEISALLEFPVETGEKFWAVVQEIDEKGILLVREKGVALSEMINPAVRSALQRLSLRSEQSVTQLLTRILDSLLDTAKPGQSTSLRDQLLGFIKEAIPEWSMLSGEEGRKAIVGLVKRFGLDYERRVRNSLNLSTNLQGKERLELTQTLKGILLSFLTEGLEEGDPKSVHELLDHLTEQQLILHGASSENPFYLLDIPIQHGGQVYNQRFAIKAARKGNKIDLGHCRLAIQANTPTLGELGLEGWLYEGQLSLKVLSHDPSELNVLIEENKAFVQERLSRLGIVLNSLGVDQIREAEGFYRFLRGEQREGVDFQA